MVLELEGVAQNPPKVHTFKNPFFKYHGKWEKGLIKSGPGTILMDNGHTYVACSFTEGEISGEGVRVRCPELPADAPAEKQADAFHFHPSCEVYQGQFRKGEAHGYGTQEKKLLINLRGQYSAYQTELEDVGLASPTTKKAIFGSGSAMAAAAGGGAVKFKPSAPSAAASRPESRGSSSGGVKGMSLDAYMGQKKDQTVVNAAIVEADAGFGSRTGTPGTINMSVAASSGDAAGSSLKTKTTSGATGTRMSGSKSASFSKIEQLDSPKKGGSGENENHAHFDDSIPLAAQDYIEKQKIQFAKYSGYWKENRYHGEGKLVTEKFSYRGQFVDHKFHGEGRLKLKNGERYAGQFVHSTYDGEGVQRTETAGFVSGFGPLSYVGQFQAGKRNGTGSGKCGLSSLTYSGAWSDDLPIAKSCKIDIVDPAAAIPEGEDKPASLLIPKSEETPNEYNPLDMKRDALPITWLLNSVDGERTQVTQEGGRKIRIFLCPAELTEEETANNVAPDAAQRRCHESTGSIEGGELVLTWDALPVDAGAYKLYIVDETPAQPTRASKANSCFQPCGTLVVDVNVLD
ncbi:unnamed protein product [Amoebophrya sp. A120]|nr:unnamed protein product [Amoebophrya sp. A120]|eukprot:GSA120T00012663001.1